MDGTAKGLAQIDGLRFDTVVIGGGILGAGIAMLLSDAGRDCLLVEQQDFAQGTTSRSTRLVHGGLRYLAMYDFGLVREGLRERAWQLAQTPHLVTPLPFLLPHYDVSLLERTKIRLGLTFYDALSPRGSLPRHKRLDRAEVGRLEPALTTDGLRSADLFWDGQVELPERLVIELLRRASDRGASVHNHVAAVGLRIEHGSVAGVELCDQRSGEAAFVGAGRVINASGPWADRTLRRLGIERQPLLRLSQGVHLVYPQLARHAVAVEHPRDGRLCFAIPWTDATLVGTTDTDVGRSPADAQVRREDIDYLAELVQRCFPAAHGRDPWWATVGVRALRTSGGKSSFVTRRHALVDHSADGARGLLTLVGGKLTAWRSIASDVARRLGVIVGPRPNGSFPAEVASLSGTAAGSQRLWRIYGARASEVSALVERDAWWGEPIIPGGDALRAEVTHAIGSEWAVTLSDVVVRRLALGFGPDLGRTAASAVAEVCLERLGWSRERVERELHDFDRENEERRVPPASAAR